MSNSKKIAVILAGGKGTRLSSVVSDVPKPLAPIAGEPFLFIILRSLKKLGFSQVLLLTGYMHEKIFSACGDGSQFGLEILYSLENEPLGTAGALKNSENILKNYSDFLLLNGDTYLECSLENFLETSLDSAIGLIGTMKPEETSRFGSLDVDAENNIKQFKEKDQQSSGLVNAGIYRLSTEILQHIPEKQLASLETDVFPNLIKDRFPLKAFMLEGEFVDIGVPESYLAFNSRILKKKEALQHAND